jgi:hypothetical protein
MPCNLNKSPSPSSPPPPFLLPLQTPKLTLPHRPDSAAPRCTSATPAARSSRTTTPAARSARAPPAPARTSPAEDTGILLVGGRHRRRGIELPRRIRGMFLHVCFVCAWGRGR